MKLIGDHNMTTVMMTTMMKNTTKVSSGELGWTPQVVGSIIPLYQYHSRPPKVEFFFTPPHQNNQGGSKHERSSCFFQSGAHEVSWATGSCYSTQAVQVEDHLLASAWRLMGVPDGRLTTRTSCCFMAVLHVASCLMLVTSTVQLFVDSRVANHTSMWSGEFLHTFLDDFGCDLLCLPDLFGNRTWQTSPHHTHHCPGKFPSFPHEPWFVLCFPMFSL